MIKNIVFALVLVLLAEIPAIGTVPPPVLKEKVTVWSGTVELRTDVVVPAGSTLIISPGTEIFCVYENEADIFTPEEWRIIVKGTLIASGEAQNMVTIDPAPYGISAIRIPVDENIKRISIAPQKVDTKKIREEFSVFRLQYLALWSMLFAGVYFAIKSRKD